MRWLAFPIALAAGLSLAFVVGSSAQSVCPSGYHPTARHHITLCLRTVTRTATQTIRLAAIPAPSVAATTPGPTTTILQPAAAVTVTGPTTTETRTATQTITDTTVSTETTTVQAPAETTTVTVTAAPPSTVSLAWCGGYGGNWADGNCDTPPNPLSVPSGSRVELAAVAQGGSATDPTPAGCLDFTVPQHPVAAVWSEYDQEYGLNPAASRDCSCVENFSGQASGACLYTFGVAGVYEVSVASSAAAPITTDVQVG